MSLYMFAHAAEENTTFINEYLSLLTDPAHIAFELTLTAIIDGLLLGIAWPLAKRAVRKHDIKHHSV